MLRLLIKMPVIIDIHMSSFGYSPHVQLLRQMFYGPNGDDMFWLVSMIDNPLSSIHLQMYMIDPDLP